MYQWKKWLSAASQEVADSVEILNQGIWHTYWHDGTNKDVSVKARISAQAGTGVAGSITQQDLSMESKSITAMSNLAGSTSWLLPWSWTAKRFCRSYFRCSRKKDQ